MQSSVDRSHKAAKLPEGLSETHDEIHSGGGSRGWPASGSGKGGHDPNTLGENKGLGAHKAGGENPTFEVKDQK